MAARQATTPDDPPELPRAAAHLVGHKDAEAVLETAFRSGRLAHAWLISGPRGVGKATLAYRFARFVLANGGGGDDGAMSLGLGLDGPAGLAVAPESDVFRRVAALAHGNLISLEFEINPKTNRMRTEVVVEQVRRLIPFFGLTAAESGWRVAVIDSADDLNASAANALLKILEEPPDKALLLLTAHQPGRVLATIRSRCRALPLRPLGQEAMSRFLEERMPSHGAEERATLARLAGGSPGRALHLGALDGIEIYGEMVGLLAGLPGRLDILTLHRLADRVARRGQEDAYKVLIDFFIGWLARLVRGASLQQSGDEIVAGEGEAMRKLAAARPLDEWIGVWEKVTRFVARADAVNLDRKQVVLYVFSAVDPAAR